MDDTGPERSAPSAAADGDGAPRSADAGGALDRRDAQALSRFGYVQELRRALGGFANFAISFSIISVLTGITTTYGTALSSGGPAALGLGWPVVCVGTMLVALAMAELASAFPTAGALYHWAALLGGAGWGWITAAMNLAGQCAIVAAIDLGCAQFLTATLRLPASTTLPLYAVILATHGLLNALSVRIVAWLNSFSATVHVVGVAILVSALFALGRRHGPSYLVETGFTTRDDGSYGLGFLNALVLGMWTFTGYDASAHVSEETHDPARGAPWGIVTAVGVSAIAGFFLVAALTLGVGDLGETVKDASPPLFILRSALGESAGNAAMGLAIVAMWFCGLSSVTSASRMLFAFARDGGIPFAAAIRRVSPRHGTPVVATAVATFAPLLLVLATSRFADSVFLAVASLATTGLYVSYGIPIALGAVARHRGVWRHVGPWNLGAAGLPIAWLAVAWSFAVLVVCSLPPNTTAGAMLAGLVVAVLVLYAATVRGRFAGPKITIASLERD